MTAVIGNPIIMRKTNADIRIADNFHKEDFMEITLGTGYPIDRPTVAFETDIEDNGMVAAIGMDYTSFNLFVDELLILREKMKLQQMKWMLTK